MGWNRMGWVGMAGIGRVGWIVIVGNLAAAPQVSNLMGAPSLSPEKRRWTSRANPTLQDAMADGVRVPSSSRTSALGSQLLQYQRLVNPPCRPELKWLMRFNCIGCQHVGEAFFTRWLHVTDPNDGSRVSSRDAMMWLMVGPARGTFKGG